MEFVDWINDKKNILFVQPDFPRAGKSRHEEAGWTDYKIRKFRRNIRRHNICIRQRLEYHSNILERKKLPLEEAKELRKKSLKEIRTNYIDKLPDVWVLVEYHP